MKFPEVLLYYNMILYLEQNILVQSAKPHRVNPLTAYQVCAKLLGMFIVKIKDHFRFFHKHIQGCQKWCYYCVVCNHL